MNLLVLTHCFPTHGSSSGIFVKDHAELLKEEGNEVFVAKVGKYGSGLNKIFNAHKEFRATRVIAHWLYPAGVLAYIFSKMTDVRYHVICHGKDVHMLKNPFWRFVARRVCRNASTVQTVSNYLARELVKYRIVDRSKILICPMPVSKEFKIEGKRRFERCPVFVCVGNYIKRKRQKFLIDALYELKHRWGQPFLIGFYGDGDRSELQAYALERLGECATVNKSVPRAELVRIYNRADCLIHPAVNEGWGMVIEEAKACGTKVLAADSGSMNEHGDVRLFLPDDFESLVWNLRVIAIECMRERNVATA